MRTSIETRIPGSRRQSWTSRLGRLSSLLGCFATFGFAQFQFSYEPAERVWRLSNGVIEALFQLTPTDNFEFQQVTDLRTGEVWAAADRARSAPFRLQVGDEILDAMTQFRLVIHSTRAVSRRGYRQTIVMRDLKGLGQLTLELEMYENQPVLRYRTRFRNLQSAQVRVRQADMLPWAFQEDNRTFRVFRVNQWVRGGTLGNFEPLTSTLSPQGGSVSLASGAYGQHCGWLALRDGSDNGLFAGWEFDGRASASVRQVRNDGALRLSASILELNRPLDRAKEFSVPTAFVGLYRGDWDEAGYRTQRFVEAVLAKPLPDSRFPWVAWDSWKYQLDLDETTLRSDAEIAARIGVELFVLDLGWAHQIGDWQADPGKFPSGLRAFSDHVHSLGMKFGLHFALAEAAPDSPVLRANPDWTSSESYGYFGAVSLCLSHQPVKDWLIEEAVRMIDEYNVDWILQDGENMVKRCTKSTHTHDPLDSNYSNAVDGLNAVIAEIQRRRPRVHWENCEDGGNMMTFNMVKNYVTSINADDSGPMTTRQAVYGATYPFPPRYTDRYMGDEELDRYKTRSYMFGGPWILMNRLSQMRPEDLELAASEIAVYKATRARIRDSKVYHLTSRPAENRMDALQGYNEATDSSVVVILRPEVGGGSARIMRLRGLKPEQNYQVRFQESARVLTATGQQLMEQGVRVDLPGMWSTEIVYVEPLKQGASDAPERENASRQQNRPSCRKPSESQTNQRLAQPIEVLLSA